MEINRNLMRTIAIYPGRWQPWHKGHKASYDYLVAQYGVENVYITSTDVTDSYKSPFTFEEKKEMMVLSGIPADKILLVKQQYNLKAVAPLIAGFNMNTDRVLFAISRKDMLSDPRFNNFMLKSGQPAYLQPAPEDVTKIEPAVKHGYLIVVPTKMFSVLGNAVKSASGLRDMYKKLTPEKKKQFIIDLFGKFDKAVLRILDGKLSGKTKLKPIAEDFLEEDEGEIAPHSKDAQRANVLAATQMIKAKQFNTKDAQDSLKAAKDRFLDTKPTDEPDIVDRAKETMKQKELALKAQKNNLSAAQKKLVAVKQGGSLS